MKDYYALLEIAPASPSDEIKRAFRAQIARYHPDKVQHLGKEFQAMAAERAADLTEGWRILGSGGARNTTARVARERRARSREATASDSAAQAPPAEQSRARLEDEGRALGQGEWFSAERATRDEYVRKATLGRFMQAFDVVMGKSYDAEPARGFDVSFVPKKGFFGGAKGPRLLGRFVPMVDAATVGDTLPQVAKLTSNSKDEICVFLMGSAMAARKELEQAIADQRRKQRPVANAAKVNLIPIDTRVWDAHVPVDVPAAVKNLLARLRAGS